MRTFREIAEGINSIKDIKSKYIDDLDKFNVSDRDKIYLSLIKVKEKSQGTGTKIMWDLVDYADKTNKMIVLSPSKEFGGTVSRLIKFYKRFGFVENKGKNKDYEISYLMYRIPMVK